MAVSFLNHDIKFKLNNQRILKRWISDVISSHKKSIGNICYIFTSEEYILELNNKYLKHNYYTDIITFEYNSEKYVSGDLFICIETVRSNAEKYAVEFSQELNRVIIHGVLHLLGFDDITEEDIEIMRNNENKCLEILHSFFSHG